MRNGEKKALRLQPLNIVMLILAVTLSVVILVALHETSAAYDSMSEGMDKYLICADAAESMQDGSDYLTLQARNFAVTGEKDSLENYFNEVRNTRRRDKALEKMGEYFDGTKAYLSLENALKRSNSLMLTEYRAMRLVADAKDYDLSEFPEEIIETELSEEDKALTSSGKIKLAQELLFGEEYQERKAEIEEAVNECLESMLGEISLDNDGHSERLSRAITRQRILVILLLAIVLVIVIMISRLIIKPLRESVSFIMENKMIPENGAYEMQYLARTYNHIFEKTKDYQDQLTYEANHDPLTGLLNRGVFDEVREVSTDEELAMILIDIDHFKEFNDTYGHETGDKVLIRLANVLKDAFRSEDYVCRIGGDEFAVIMVNVTDRMKGLISMKIENIRSKVRDKKDEVPGFTLSMGVAFSDKETETDLYKNADEALYKAKDAGRDGYAFYR